MPDYEIVLSLVVQVLENRRYLGEALFFPEFSCFRAKGTRLKADARHLAEVAARRLPAVELHSRHLSGKTDAGEIRLTVEPPRKSRAWIAPVTLTFGVVRWTHGDEGAHLAWVPGLGIEVIGSTADERDKMLEREILAALLRTKSLASLRNLVWLRRAQKLRLVSLPATVSRLSPKHEAIAEEERRKAIKSVLAEVATDLTREWLTEAYECDQVVGRMHDTLAGRQPTSVLLVGPSGVGKTAAVHELVRRRDKLQLGSRPFWQTSGARLVAGMSGFGMWEERCQKVCREAAKTHAILHLGNLVELMEVGKSTASTIGIAGFLRPALARGDLVAIAECTPEQLPLIERLAPQLLDAFHQVAVTEPTPAAGRRILERVSANFRVPNYVAATRGSAPLLATDALDTLDRLHRRYATASAFPGRPVRFLQNLLQDAFIPHRERGAPDRIPVPRLDPLRASDITAAFSKETGLPRFLLDATIPIDLAETKAWLARRVIGQSEPVDLIVDLLATVKAGLTRPRKPIASLMFIGPTGVGKTEMSKTLAEFLFGSPQRLTRFDMSEFSDRLAVSRLIGGVFGSEGLLTAKVREQPFSVLLFDEVEKADPQFFDILLQVLGEGRLTDAGGRLADFCNSVVIMTSNLGAATFQQGSAGFIQNAKSREDAARHFELAVRAFVRPELFNRIDRIVPFAPLDEDSILSIAHRQLDELQQRDGIKYRGVALRLAPETPKYLAEKGFDPRYGARPLKRRIERELLAPLADRLNRYAADLALEADVSVDAGRLHVAVRARPDQRGRGLPLLSSENGTARVARQVIDLRRQHQLLEGCPAVVEMQSEIYRLSEWEKRLLRDAARKRAAGRVWQRPDVAPAMAQLARLRQIADEIRDVGEAIVGLEETVLCRLHGTVAADEGPFEAQLDALRELWEALLLKLYLLRFPEPDRVTLALFSEDPKTLFEFAAAYAAAARDLATEFELYQFTAVQTTATDTPLKQEGEADPFLWRRQVEFVEESLEIRPPGVIGLAFALRGPGALPRFTPEAGLHEFTEPERTVLCLVETADAKVSEYLPPPGIERRGKISGPDRRRVYVREAQEARDIFLKARFNWFGRGLPAVLVEMIEQRFQRDARFLLNDNADHDSDLL